MTANNVDISEGNLASVLKNSLVKQQTAFLDVVDDLGEVVALNSFFFEAVEAINESRLDTSDHPDNHFGLVLFSRYLRERNMNVKKSLKQCCTNI